MAKKKDAAPKNALKHPNAIGIKEGFGYTLGDIGNLLVLTFISTFLKVFYTDSLMVGLEVSEKRIFNDLTLLFLVTRLWDAINDPMWGLIVDAKKPTKDGKFRPYLKWLSIPLCVSMAVCFLGINKFISSYVVILIFAYITYTCFGMLYTGVNIPYGSLASVITDDPKGRTLLSTFRSIGGGIGGAVVTLLGQMVVFDKVPDGDEIKSVFNGDKAFIFAVILAALAIASYLFCFKTTKERVKVPDEKKKINLKRTYGPLFKSLPFITVTLSGVLISGLLQYGSFNQYLFKNHFGNSDLSIINTLCTYAPMAIMIPIMPKLVEKFGKKEICVFGLFLSSAASIYNAVFLPNVTTYFVMQALTGFGYSFMSITNWAIVMDVIDYNEYTTGEHSESAIYAVYTFSRKLGQTIADSGGMQLLYKTGYNEKLKDNISKNVGGFGHNIYKMCTIVPAIVYTLILILTIIYPLSKKKLEPMQKELMKRRAMLEEKVNSKVKELESV